MIEARRGSKSMPKRIAACARLAGGTARSGAAPSVAPVGGNLGQRGHALANAAAINRRRRRPFVLYFQDRIPRRLGFPRCCPQAVEFGIGGDASFPGRRHDGRIVLAKASAPWTSS